MELGVLVVFLQSIEVGKVKRDTGGENIDVFQLQLLAEVVQSSAVEDVGYLKAYGCQLLSLVNKLLHALAELGTSARYHDIGASGDSDESAVHDLVVLEQQVCEAEDYLLLQYEPLAVPAKVDYPLGAAGGSRDNAYGYALFGAKLHNCVDILVFEKGEGQRVVDHYSRYKGLQFTLEIELKEGLLLLGRLVEGNVLKAVGSQLLHSAAESLLH